MREQHYVQVHYVPTGFFKRFDDLLFKNNMNRSMLARRIGVNRKTIYRFEQGNRNMNVDTYMKICTVLNVSADYLYWGKEKCEQEHN